MRVGDGSRNADNACCADSHVGTLLNAAEGVGGGYGQGVRCRRGDADNAFDYVDVVTDFDGALQKSQVSMRVIWTN